ncbi:unnamed protein product [Linum trigynum]|uniref:Uncharacterized protein n=1 Tax=Linum trigynum TaxID=586398 RepID=A0AAV2F1T1_9ROSI
MDTLTSSSSSEPQSPLLPLQHHNANSPSATAADPTTTVTDPPPPRSLSAVDHYKAVYPYKVEASVFQAAGNDSSSSSSAGGGGQQYLLASTRRFTGSTAKPGQDHTTFSIQLRAEEADVGEHAVADVIEAAEGNRLRFKLLVLVWVRVNDRYYLARIGCDPVWIESSSFTVREFRKNTKKCQVQV